MHEIYFANTSLTNFKDFGMLKMSSEPPEGLKGTVSAPQGRAL